jgi:pilus assembly protein CpaF
MAESALNLPVVPRLLERKDRASQILSKGAQDLKSTIHRELINRVDLDKLMRLPDGRTRQQLLGVIHELINRQEVPLSTLECDALAREVMDEVFGFGPLEPLLQDPTVNDILVNTYNTVYVERNGVLEETKVVFKDNVHLMHIIDKIVSGVGRRVDESSPMVGRPPARWLARQRDHTAAGRRWPHSLHTPLRFLAAHRRRPARQRRLYRGDA